MSTCGANVSSTSILSSLGHINFVISHVLHSQSLELGELQIWVWKKSQDNDLCVYNELTRSHTIVNYGDRIGPAQSSMAEFVGELIELT